MKTVGEILKQTRLKEGLSFEEIEKAIKIRRKYLIALEENDFLNLPAFTFSRGLLKNYSEFLGLSSKELIAIFRRQVKEEKTELLPQKIDEGSGFRITPKTGVIFSSAFIFSIFIFYLLLQFLSLVGKPYLKIYYPSKNLTVKTELIEIKGKTDQEGKVFINNQEIPIMENGNFSEKISLNKGENKIAIVAKNKAGKENKKIVVINYK